MISDTQILEVIDLLREIAQGFRELKQDKLNKKLQYGKNPVQGDIITAVKQILTDAGRGAQAGKQEGLTGKEILERLEKDHAMVFKSTNPVNYLKTMLWRDGRSGRPTVLQVAQRYRLAPPTIRLSGSPLLADRRAPEVLTESANGVIPRHA